MAEQEFSYMSGTEARPVGFESTTLHFYEMQSSDASGLEIYGYTDAFSYAPGDRVAFHVSTPPTDASPLSRAPVSPL